MRERLKAQGVHQGTGLWVDSTHGRQDESIVIKCLVIEEAGKSIILRQPKEIGRRRSSHGLQVQGGVDVVPGILWVFVERNCSLSHQSRGGATGGPCGVSWLSPMMLWGQPA